MRFNAFFDCLRERHVKTNTQFVSADLLASIISDHHMGIGTVDVRYFEDFEGAQWGNFILCEEQRTSAYEEAFFDAEIYVNDKFRDNPAWRRLVASKELMHVFDDTDRRAGTPEAFVRLVNDIVNNPLSDDQSEPYRADRSALWKATLSLVPPWLRDAPDVQGATTEELAARWLIPPPIVSAAMSDYYTHTLLRFGISK